MLTLFWDSQGPLVEYYMPRGTTVISASYWDLLKNQLKPAVRSQRRGRLTTSVLLQHDDARPHTTHATAATMEDMHLECLPYPLYSTDLTPSDYHIFGPLIEELGGTTFRSDEEVQEVVPDVYTRSQHIYIFSRAIQALVKRWKNALNWR